MLLSPSAPSLPSKLKHKNCSYWEKTITITIAYYYYSDFYIGIVRFFQWSMIYKSIPIYYCYTITITTNDNWYIYKIIFKIMNG
jgi:hypothetical protein